MIKKRYAKEKWILDILKLLITAVYSGTVYFWWVKFINPYIPIPFFRYGNYLIGALLVAVYASSRFTEDFRLAPLPFQTWFFHRG